MNWHGVDGTDIAMLITFTALGALFIGLGIIILMTPVTITSIILAGMLIVSGFSFAGVINYEVTGDILHSYNQERKWRERQDITRVESWS